MLSPRSRGPEVPQETLIEGKITLVDVDPLDPPPPQAGNYRRHFAARYSLLSQEALILLRWLSFEELDMKMVRLTSYK